MNILNVFSDFSAEKSSPLNPNLLILNSSFLLSGSIISSINVISIFLQRIIFPNSVICKNSLFSNLHSFEMLTIPTSIKNSIALINSASEIASVAHHPAVFLTHLGTDSESVIEVVVDAT